MASDTINQRYLALKAEVVRQSSRLSDTDHVKFLFESDIGSRRRLDNIRNAADLISVLEKRNVLNANDLHCIETIVEALQLCNVNLNIHSNHTGNRLPPVVVQEPNRILQEHNRVLVEESPSMRERIYKLLTQQIGKHWKELARNLQISAGQIDELDEQYRLNPPERIREILRYHESNSDDSSYFKLMDALSASRRKDLRNKIQEILSRRDLLP